jgi:hypothetical protein
MHDARVRVILSPERDKHSGDARGASHDVRCHTALNHERPAHTSSWASSFTDPVLTRLFAPHPRYSGRHNSGEDVQHRWMPDARPDPRTAALRFTG